MSGGTQRAPPPMSGDLLRRLIGPMQLRHGVLATGTDFVLVATQAHHRLVTFLVCTQRLEVRRAGLPDSVAGSLLFR